MVNKISNLFQSSGHSVKVKIRPNTRMMELGIVSTIIGSYGVLFYGDCYFKEIKEYYDYNITGHGEQLRNLLINNNNMDRNNHVFVRDAQGRCSTVGGE